MYVCKPNIVEFAFCTWFVQHVKLPFVHVQFPCKEVCVLLQVHKQYNENTPSTNPKFELRVEILEQTDRRFLLKTCFRHLEEGSSGMSLLNIGVPTGFDPDLNERQHTAVFSRSERNGNTLTLYFNEVSKRWYTLLFTWECNSSYTPPAQAKYDKV